MHRLPHLAVLMLVTGIALAQTTEPAVRPEEPVKDQTPQPRFDVLEYQVEGNSVLSDIAIENAVRAFLGYDRGIADVEKAREALEKAYQNAGYLTVLVDIPEQDVKGGIVRLVVIEASVQRLRVTGSRYYSLGRIKAQAQSLEPGTVPYFPDVQKELSGLNRYPDRKVTPVLKPGRTPGTVQVDLKVEDKFPLHGNVELNDRYSGDTSRTRLGTMLRYDNLWQREHSAGLQVQVSPKDTSQVKVFSGSYTVPMGTGLLVASAIRSNSNTVAGVGGTEVFGRGNIYGLRRVLVLGSTETQSQSLTLSASYKQFKESVSVGGNAGFSTPIRYLPLGISYSGAVTGKDGTWQGGTGLVVALRGLASDQAQFADKRFRAQSNFSFLTFDLSRSENLPWGMSFFGKLEGQVSDQPLISNEQFVAGGVDSVRGYLEATSVGDKGLRGTLELRSQRFTRESWGWFGGLRVHAFAEGAGLWLNSPLPAQQSRFGLLSAGLGLRLQAREYVSLALDVGWPLRDVGNTRKGKARVHASGVLEF